MLLGRYSLIVFGCMCMVSEERVLWALYIRKGRDLQTRGEVHTEQGVSLGLHLLQ